MSSSNLLQRKSRDKFAYGLDDFVSLPYVIELPAAAHTCFRQLVSLFLAFIFVGAVALFFFFVSSIFFRAPASDTRKTISLP